jgi:hypothetical protein
LFAIVGRWFILLGGQPGLTTGSFLGVCCTNKQTNVALR